MTGRRALWIAPVALIAYHAERSWMLARQAGDGPVGTATPWVIAAGIVGLVAAAITAWASASRPGGVGLYAFLVMLALAGCNAVALLVLAIRRAAYEPGLVTGALLVLPSAVYLIERLVRQGDLGRRRTLLLLGVGGAVYLAMAWAMPGFVEWLDECIGCA